MDPQEEKNRRREAILKMTSWSLGPILEGSTQPTLADAVKAAIAAEKEIEAAISEQK